MKYRAFRSIVNSQKQPIQLATASDSFFAKIDRVNPYIEPSLSKIDFPTEKPPLILVTAMGASGKTTTAHALSFDTNLPVLDLARHKPVGDNTLTGILTSAYPIERIGAVLNGLRSGTHGIIIDGIDEARSKTSEKAFEAFLDDLIERSRDAQSTTIVVFGRSQVLLDVWCYLVDHSSEVGLVQIDPFSLDQARRYIDSLALSANPSHRATYEQARDIVLDKLGSAFSGIASDSQDSFLSFIGYPPVLDAVATLLDAEHNYHRIQQALDVGGGGTDLEIKLLIRISDYLLERDHQEKALPNFIQPILADMPTPQAQSLSQVLYDCDEQCARVLAHALDTAFPRQVIEDTSINERYEEAVTTWCQDHPFLRDAHVRNSVFASVAVARCALSEYTEYRSLAHAYVCANPPTSHLLHIMKALSNGRTLSVNCFNMLMQSCAEFVRINASIFCEISGESWEDSEDPSNTSAELSIDIAYSGEDHRRSISFIGRLDTDLVSLGPYLLNAQVTLPGEVQLTGSPAVTAIGECTVSARVVRIDTADLIVRPMPRSHTQPAEQTGLFITARTVCGHADLVIAGPDMLTIACGEHIIDYPLAGYLKKVAPEFPDPEFNAKYRRLRRILLEFRSHSKGGLAKYRDKIEHERVLQNEIGKRVLESLVKEGILRTDAKFYHINSDKCDQVLGISWHQLRQYQSSKKLDQFLKDI